MQIKTFNCKNENDFQPIIDNKYDLLIIFGNNLDLIEKLQKKTTSVIIGSSSELNISNKNVSDPNVLSVAALKFAKTTISKYLVKDFAYEDSKKSGIEIWQKLNSQPGLSGALILTAGLNIDGMALAEGINSQNTSNISIIGGMAGDEMKFNNTFVFTQEEIVNVGVLAVGFYGDSFKLSVGSGSGMQEFGIEREITKSDKNVLIEIDHSPALDIYDKSLSLFLDEKNKEIHYPLEISPDFKTKSGLVRTPLKIDRVNKTISLASEVPEGFFMKLMLALPSELVSVAEKVNKDNLTVPNSLSLIVSCAARHAVLGGQVLEEVPKNRAYQIGFYSFGEFTNINTSCELVNQTFTQAIMYEID